MSRSGYSEDLDQWDLIRWRGAVASAIRGKRGQAFLREMLAALDALPEPVLIAEELELDGQVCAIGSVGRERGVDMAKLDPEEPDIIAGEFGVSRALVQEIEYINDEESKWCKPVTPEERFQHVRAWVASQIKNEAVTA